MTTSLDGSRLLTQTQSALLGGRTHSRKQFTLPNNYNDATPAVSFGSDQRGRQTTITRNAITTTLAYNDASQLTDESYFAGLETWFGNPRYSRFGNMRYETDTPSALGRAAPSRGKEETSAGKPALVA